MWISRTDGTVELFNRKWRSHTGQTVESSARIWRERRPSPVVSSTLAVQGRTAGVSTSMPLAPVMRKSSRLMYSGAP
ncbi:hypothetical protein [Microvirga sp. M2]|uniref:hypothetical protein n=1 Tax=Microvirga sp. M2 TaxID=3073270 RepID=UPI0039C35FBE